MFTSLTESLPLLSARYPTPTHFITATTHNSRHPRHWIHYNCGGERDSSVTAQFVHRRCSICSSSARLVRDRRLCYVGDADATPHRVCHAIPWHSRPGVSVLDRYHMQWWAEVARYSGGWRACIRCNGSALRTEPVRAQLPWGENQGGGVPRPFHADRVPRQGEGKLDGQGSAHHPG